MRFHRLAFALLASTSATACFDDEPPPPPTKVLPGNDAHLGKLSPQVLSRAVAAASGQDVTVALYTADLLPRIGGTCVKISEADGKRVLSADGCTTDAGVTIHGEVRIEGPAAAPTRIVFEALEIEGGPDLIIDGEIATQHLAGGDLDRQVDLAMERDGVSIHTVLDYQQRGERRHLFAGAHLDLPTGGPTGVVWLADGTVRLRGGDELDFKADASIDACDRVGYREDPAPGMELGPHAENPDAPPAITRVCLWTPFAHAGATGERGALKAIDVCPATGAPRVVVVTTARDELVLETFEVGTDGARTPQATSRWNRFGGNATTPFRVDDIRFGVPCDNTARAWAVTQGDHGHHELLTSPPIEFVW